MLKLLAKPEIGSKLVCVSTSLIEAGVDVSVNTVIRYLNGFDNIVQSGGRCERHATGMLEGHVYIVNEPKAIPMYRDQQNATGTVIAKYGRDLTDEITSGLALYYKDYIRSLNKEKNKPSVTKFPCCYKGSKEYQTTLTDLWGTNCIYESHHPSKLALSKKKAAPMPYHHSMVRTAQRKFSVIEDNNREVIVNMDERCEDLLQAYENADSFRVLIELQRQLQQYAVSLTKKDHAAVSEWIGVRSNSNLDISISVISGDGCYDIECGIMPASDDDFIL